MEVVLNIMFLQGIVCVGTATLAAATLHSLLNRDGGMLEFFLFCTSLVVFFKVLF